MILKDRETMSNRDISFNNELRMIHQIVENSIFAQNFDEI